MKWITVFIALFVSTAIAREADLGDVYGNGTAGCTVASDIDDGDADRIGALTRNKLYTVFCYDSATFEGVACRFLQGGSTVDASSGEGSDGEGELLIAGEKVAVWVSGAGSDYISFEPLADGTTQIGVACQKN